MQKRMGAMLALIPVVGAGIFSTMPNRTRVSASVAPAHYQGASATGVIAEDLKGVVAEKQTITVYANDMDFSAEEGTVPYVVSEYVLSNPSQQNISLKMYYPNALPRGYDVKKSVTSITLDGEPVQTKTRYSYAGYYETNNFDLSEDVSLLTADGYDPFYRQPQLPVKRYHYKVTIDKEAFQSNKRRFLTYSIFFDCDANKTRVASPDCMAAAIENGRVRASFDIEEGVNEFELCVIGEDIRNPVNGIYEDRYGGKLIEAHGEYIEIDEESTDFESYALSYRPKNCAVGPEDWCRGLAQMFTSTTTSRCLVWASADDLNERYFTQWSEYELTIPAETRVVHTVRSDIYPSLEPNSQSGMFTYLLSPQSNFGLGCLLEVNLITPYRLAGSSLEFTKTEQGYSLERSAYPLGELTFTLSGSSEYGTVGSNGYGMSPSLRLAYILLGVLGGIGIVCVAIGVGVHYGKKKKRR